ncbi:uncharacterized protein LOC108163238 isoform X2 [Drosophila miranda]|uniref:uncharacterized protein LOC108163238 isoform X2 n=1 Tax=Drosophila miranda TaxID=7229 RepID=UPI0007E866E1|nr:uncharacterized protein LOC108163238 isoform X2 [Drosophila miranda]
MQSDHEKEAESSDKNGSIEVLSRKAAQKYVRRQRRCKCRRDCLSTGNAGGESGSCRGNLINDQLYIYLDRSRKELHPVEPNRRGRPLFMFRWPLAKSGLFFIGRSISMD